MNRTARSCALCAALALVACVLGGWALWIATGRGAPVYQLLAWSAEDRNDYPRAIGYWQKAVRGRPQDAELREGLAIALEHAGREQEALEQYREAVRLDPKRLNSWLAIYILCSHVRDTRGAVRALREATKLADTQPGADPEVREVLRQCAEGNAELLALYDQVEAAEARHAKLLAEVGRLKQATAEADVRIGQSCALLGQVRETAGDRAKAVKAYEEGAAHGNVACQQRLAELRRNPPVPLSSSRAFL